MKESKSVTGISLDLNTTDSRSSPISTEGLDTLTVQAELVSGSWGSGVVSIFASCDPGGQFIALATPAATISASGFTHGVTVTGYPYVRLIVTTASGSEARAVFSVYAMET
jgi:hypothetical protein